MNVYDRVEQLVSSPTFAFSLTEGGPSSYKMAAWGQNELEQD